MLPGKPATKITEFYRFLIVGVVNTATTYLLYLLFHLLMPYLVAYTAAYVTAIIVSYYLNAKWVFRTGVSVRSFAGFPLVYAAQYAISTGMLYLFVEYLGIAETLAPLLAVILTVPVTFVMARFVLTRFQSRKSDLP
jgi:putative flippase GtrA